MSPLHSFFAWSARHGRLVLIAGLIAGITLPALAQKLQAWLPEMVAALLFIAALRIAPRDVFANAGQIKSAVTIVVLYQIILPLTLLLVFRALGLNGPIPLAIIVMTSAASIAGSANLAILTGHEPAPALLLLVVGTAALPLTILPVFLLLPELGTPSAVFVAAFRLLGLIVIAAGSAWLLRQWLMSSPSTKTVATLDGISAWAMAIVVVGLMAAVAPALWNTPALTALTLAAAFAANFGLQLIAWIAFRHPRFATQRVSYAIVAGNRNMALFLSSLPAMTMEPLLLFIGCYQIPMYITPVFLHWLTRRQRVAP